MDVVLTRKIFNNRENFTIFMCLLSELLHLSQSMIKLMKNIDISY